MSQTMHALLLLCELTMYRYQNLLDYQSWQSAATTCFTVHFLCGCRYSMMQWCWEMEPGKRPSFSTLVKTLSTSLENQAGYLRVGAFTNPDSSSDHTMEAQTKSSE